MNKLILSVSFSPVVVNDAHLSFFSRPLYSPWVFTSIFFCFLRDLHLPNVAVQLPQSVPSCICVRYLCFFFLIWFECKIKYGGDNCICFFSFFYPIRRYAYDGSLINSLWHLQLSETFREGKILSPLRQLWFVYHRIGFRSLTMTWVEAKKVFCSTILSVKPHPASHFPVTNHLGNSICLCLETEVAVAHCEQFSINFLDKISQIYTELMGTVRAELFQEKTNVLIPLIGLKPVSFTDALRF